MNRTYNFVINDRRCKPFWKQALTTVCLAGVFFGPGVLVDSAAMQWGGFVFLLITALLAVVGTFSSERMTIDEAREKLDKLERQEPG